MTPNFSSVEVVEAEDGPQGVEMAQEHELDIVFMDIRMPIRQLIKFVFADSVEQPQLTVKLSLEKK